MRRFIIGLAAVLLTVGVVQAVGVGAASAMPGLGMVSATSSTDSTSFRTVVAYCPAGKSITGVGAAITGGAGDVVLEGYAPVHGSSDYAIAEANEDVTGYAGNWSLTVYAFCVTMNPAIVIVSAATSATSDDYKVASVACPEGDESIGVGGWINSGAGQVYLNDVYPPGVLSGGGAIGVEVLNGYEGLWSIRAFAVCVPWSSQISEVDAESVSDASTPKTVSASCPAGTYIHGLGGRIDQDIAHETLNVVVPNRNLTAETIRGYADEYGQPLPWAIIAIAICDA